jgi:uncharacterized membrane protein YphA (DoxX/SURF4 family)
VADALDPDAVSRAATPMATPASRTGRPQPYEENLMNLALWIIAGLLAVAFLGAGAGKLIMPKEKIAAITPSARWVEDFSAGSVKAIGALEVLAAVGLVLPAALDIAPVLVPLAALGLVMLMVGAVITRIRRHEAKFMVADLVYLALAGFVMWGRFGPESFTG